MDETNKQSITLASILKGSKIPLNTTNSYRNKESREALIQ